MLWNFFKSTSSTCVGISREILTFGGFKKKSNFKIRNATNNRSAVRSVMAAKTDEIKQLSLMKYTKTIVYLHIYF